MSEVPETEYSPEGILLNPALPDDFFNTPNGERTAEEISEWWDIPIILTEKNHDSVRYDVWCLDGGAWDRPTLHGQSDSIAGADKIAVALLEEQQPAYSPEI